MTLDDDVLVSEMKAAADNDMPTMMETTPSVVNIDKDETPNNDEKVFNECCRRRRLEPEGEGGDDEEETCIGVVCDKTENATNTNKGGPSTTSTGVEEQCCCICLDNITENRVTNEPVCRHTFHENCISDWKATERGTTCPHP